MDDADGAAEDIEALARQLCAQADLFDAPEAYTAGVLDALDALAGRLPEATS